METGRGKDRWKVRDLLADARCRRPVLDFLSTTDVGRRVLVGEVAASEVSETEVREWSEEQGAGAVEPGAGGSPLFLPTFDFMASAGTAWRVGGALVFLSPFLCPLRSISLLFCTYFP